jgi:DNA/RNA-binding domain of Phe-tRNA-synthetase-like protein
LSEQETDRGRAAPGPALEIQIGRELFERYPGALYGFQQVSGAANPRHDEELERRKLATEKELRQRFASYDRPRLRELHPLDVYHRWFRSFGTAYPVQHQLESVVHKGRSIPSVAALVEAMFVAELRSLLLTAGHDLRRLHPPLRLHLAAGGEPYECINGREVALKADDIYLADEEGIVGSVLYGPDRRTALEPETEEVLFVVYALPGIQSAAVEDHLAQIVELVSLVSPQALVHPPRLLGA